MEPTIKPGTRCESTFMAVTDGHTEYTAHQCENDAVRMVTVRPWHDAVPESERSRMGLSGKPGDDRRIVPMCEACADWHESMEDHSA